MATPASILQQYPSLANDPQFMQGYQRLGDIVRTGGVAGVAAAQIPEKNALLQQLTARARQLGLPADQQVNGVGEAESIHHARNEALTGLALGGLSLVGGGLANSALSGGGAAAGAASGAALPAAATGATAAGAGTAATVGPGLAAGAKVASSVPWGKIIDAGVGLAGTYLTGRAQNKALTAQTAANQQAQQLQQQYQQGMQQRLAQTSETQRQLFSPYLSLGAGAASTLASRMGLPSGPAPGTGTPIPPYSQGGNLTPVNPGNAQGVVTQPQGAPLSDSSAGQAPGGTLASLANAPGALGALGKGALVNQATQQSQSGYVTMQAPTGETAQVHPQDIPFYTQKGARVIQAGA
jgi:hypothetical protein